MTLTDEQLDALAERLWKALLTVASDDNQAMREVAREAARWADERAPATPQAAQPEVLTMDDAARMGKSLEWWRGYTACLNAMQARVEFAAAQAQGVGRG